MSRVRVGVIGAGVWATTSHLPTLMKRANEIEMIGVCRKGGDELEKVAAQFNFKVASEDYQDVLKAGIDLCVVSSPVSLHFEHAKAALESGAHVLIEKPVTINPEHAWELVELAKRLERHVVVAFGWNYLPTYRRARELWGKTGVGKIEHVMVHMSSGIRELLSGTSLSSTGDPNDVVDTRTWTDPKISGGGYGQAQLSHALGWILGITHLRARSAFCFSGGPDGAPVELHDAIAMRFEGGASGTVSGASAHGAQGIRHQMEYRVFGSEGQLHADLERDRLMYWRAGGERQEPSLPIDAGSYHCEGPPLALLDLILGRQVENLSPIELGARTVETLEAVYRSISSGLPEKVTI
ncbi:MAG: Gfo/Idh/MocA family oxidoreductase [Acidimicrobiaceae bacterium]|nr:Gfo/Idh/MocA family oxidoreductase [Acidimicrobiaceae bacterium]